MEKPHHFVSIEHDRVRRASRKALIAKDYVDGMSFKEIGAKYNVSPGYIGQIRRLLDLPKRRPGANPEVRARVVQDYRDGTKILEIVEKHGCDRKTIWQIVKNAGMPLRRPELIRRRDARYTATEGSGGLLRSDEQASSSDGTSRDGQDDDHKAGV